MIEKLSTELAAAVLLPALTLQVAWRHRDQVKGGHVNVAGDAAVALRNRCDQVTQDLVTYAPRAYWPDAALGYRECYRIPRSDLDDSLGVLNLLDRGPDTDLLMPNDLNGFPLLFYSVVVGADSTHRFAFVSKSNPARVLGHGFFFTPAGEILTRIDTPVFLFDDRVDLISGPDEIVVFNQLAFEQWFRESPAIVTRTSEWVKGISDHLPLAGDGATKLAERAETDFRIRRLLKNINERGHLKDVSPERIRLHIKAQGLDESALMQDDLLVLDDADPMLLLKLLNEDLFLGGLTDLAFVSDAKAPRA